MAEQSNNLDPIKINQLTTSDNDCIDQLKSQDHMHYNGKMYR